ncbi:MAG: glutamate--tRNA ligase [Acidimicrobiia bacterium]|nr:glutamate--tRNA ligase [Acidimicrobiia bacterium]
MTTRLRVAPSPTGAMHVGTGRTALFNWLFARHTGGTFIVRIDDTDTARSEKAFEDDILAGLRWLGLDWDEGVGVGGPHGSYRQSDRYGRYEEVAEKLIAEETAYPCFCTPGELETRRAEAEAAGRPPGYDGRCRAIDAVDARHRRNAGERAAVRFKMPRPGTTEFVDLVRGEIRVDHQHVDDFVLLRSDRRPTYHLASTVDDVDYEITHVARGEDLLPSTPRHVQLTLAMGGKEATYAHIPLINGPDGKRLSKRHGAQGVTEYVDAGYLPEALVNYLSLLGWSPSGDASIFPVTESIRLFELTDVQKNPAVFDRAKLDWMNGEYVRALPSDRFNDLAAPYVEQAAGHPLSPEEWSRFEQLSPLIQERAKLLTDIGDQVRFLFVDHDTVVTPETIGIIVSFPEAKPIIENAIERLTSLAEFDHESIETSLRGMLDELGLNARKGLQPLRVAITGSTVSPPLFESMAALGRETVLDRLDAARSRM